MAAFVAKYRGNCAAECGEEIVPGDRVVYVDDELVHEECETDGLIRAERRHGSTREAIVCGVCFLVKPCPCDDGQSAA